MVKYDKIEVQLTGADGNGFMIIGRVSKALKQYGVSKSDIDEYRTEAMSGDYDHLLITTMQTVNVN